MSIRKYFGAGLLAGAAALGSPASAAVYTFASGQLTSIDATPDTFTLTLSAPITNSVTFQRNQFDASTGTFNRVEFCVAGTWCSVGYTNPTYDEVLIFPVASNTGVIIVDPNTGQVIPQALVSVPYDFASPAFRTTGSYTTVSGARGTLQVAAGAVPESATWAMLLLGFGMIGAASRYRRRSAVTTFA